jgi:hypothetical protein
LPEKSLKFSKNNCSGGRSRAGEQKGSEEEDERGNIQGLICKIKKIQGPLCKVKIPR